MLAWLIALWVQPSAQAQITTPYAGVTYIDRWIDTARRVHMHVAQIDLQTSPTRPPSTSIATTGRRSSTTIRHSLVVCGSGNR